MVDFQIEQCAGFQPQHRPSGFQRLNLRVQDIFLPVDVLKLLRKPELGPTQRLKLFLGARVS
jgi:hypothetical protein